MVNDSDQDVGLYSVLAHDGARLAEPVVPMGPEDLLAAYRWMRLLRLLDARMVLLQRQGRVGFYGACTGQEAVPIATGMVAQCNDWVFPALREQSVMLVRGFGIRPFIAQIFGNSGDVLKGRQMPSHPSGKAVHQVSWSSCIGPQVPQAVGAAWAMKQARANAVAFAFLGDGATSQPDFHVAMTFASKFRVPVIIVCQNNHWSISVPTSRQTAAKTIAIKARAYGMPGIRVDGNDVVAMHDVLAQARARALAGDGPTFVEAVTYRIGAHSTSDDPTRYRSEAEVESWKKKDPVDRVEARLRQDGILDDDAIASLEADLNRQIQTAIAEVEALPPPERLSLFDDVYAEPPWNLVAQRASLAHLPPAPTH